jgi:hypothetical protein
MSPIMDSRRWVNQSQPQPLYMATILLYIDAVLGLFFGSFYFVFGTVIGLACLIGLAAGAFGIANDQRWGYYLAVALTGVLVAMILWVVVRDPGLIFSLQFLIAIVFPMAMFLLLIHPQSREYQKIWFE